MEDAIGSVSLAGRDATEPTIAPIVTVAVVAQNPGDWFDEVLTSLATQDYPKIRILVLDAGSQSRAPSALGAASSVSSPIAARVAAALPDAEVQPAFGANFAAIANELLDMPRLPQFVLLCQDHVALAPNAVRRLVEEAVRSNTSILGPKLVEWHDARQIRDVGKSVDKLGVVAPYAEPGEFDQEQHDAVREVFAVAGDAMLIRTDLFRTLGGFEERLHLAGYDVDLCWRAHTAGARVMVVPTAIGRCTTDYATQRSGVGPKALGQAGRVSEIRSVLTNYSLRQSLTLIPQAIVMSLVAMVGAVAGGRFREAQQILKAWFTNLLSVGSILRSRRAVRSSRTLSDREVRRFQVSGYEVINRRLRERGEGETSRFAAVTNRARSRDLQLRFATWLVTLLAMALGSRELFSGRVPVVNQFGDISRGPVELLRGWFSSYRPSGLGSEGFAPTVELIVGSLGVLFFGQMGAVRAVLTVGMIVLGAFGMYRLLAPFGSLFAQLSAPLIYIAVPLGYNALVNGSWRALVLLGGLPWILKWLAAAAGFAPYAAPKGVWMWARQSLVAAIWVAFVGAWTPAVAGAVAIIALGLALGGIFTGRPGPIWRLVLSAAAAVAGAFALHLPWSTQLITGEARWDHFTDARQQGFGDLSLAELIRFDTGPHGGVPFGWALIALAAISLLLSQRGRLVWAVRGWMIALASFALAWLEQQSELGFSLPEPEVLLAPAAVGIALAASMGVMSFEQDLRNYGFGWRQALPALAAVALLASFLGGIGSAFGGRWDTPRNGFEIASLFLQDGNQEFARVLWIGDADSLPVGSREFVDDMAMSVTPARTPDMLDLYPPQLGEIEEDFLQVLDVALRGGTNRLGGVLGPMGIRYVVVVERLAPPYDLEPTPVSPRVLDTLAEQLDLERTEVRVGMTVYRNTAWLPTIGSVSGTALGDAGTASQLSAAVHASSVPVRTPFDAAGVDSWEGQVREGTEILLATNASSRWMATIDGTPTIRTRAIGWANAFAVPESGTMTLNHETPTTHRLALVGQLVLWGVVALVVLAGRRQP